MNLKDMNLKDLQDKIEEEPIIPVPAHYESLLDEASIWDWLRRLFGILGSPQNSTEVPVAAPADDAPVVSSSAPPPAAPVRTLQGLRKMAGDSAPKTGAASK